MLSTSTETCFTVTSNLHLRSGGFRPMCNQLGQVWERERWNESVGLLGLPPFSLSAPLLDGSPGERVGGKAGGWGASRKRQGGGGRFSGPIFLHYVRPILMREPPMEGDSTVSKRLQGSCWETCVWIQAKSNYSKRWEFFIWQVTNASGIFPESCAIPTVLSSFLRRARIHQLHNGILLIRARIHQQFLLPDLQRRRRL